ncbi:MAG: hypothetical protein ABWZ25_14810 [Chitinophagaceae bacterium]
MRFVLFVSVLSLTFLTACEKKEDSCSNFIEVMADKETPAVGEDVTLSVSRQSDYDIYQWFGPDLNETTQSETILLSDIQVSQRGWYYCTSGNTECNTALTDSVYVDVKLLQEPATCSPGNNTMTGSGIPDVVFDRVTKGLDPTWNGIALEARGAFGYPGVEVLFNSYNGNKEPEDGVYITRNIQSFSPLDEPNSISMSFIYASNYFHCEEGKKVYVKHVNGKLQVTFCDIFFASPPYPGSECTGKITEL